MHRLTAGAVLVVVLAIASTATALVVGGGGPDRCVVHGKGTPRLVLAGLHAGGREHTGLAAGTVVQARNARWHGRVPYALQLGGEGGVCLSGGSIVGTWPPQTPWRTMHSTAGIVVSGPVATVEDTRVHDYGDAIRFVDGARDWEVRRVHLSYVRDDCIEDDWLHAGTVRDSLLDGCYNAFSARTYDGQDGVSDGSANLFTVEHSLVRLQPMRTYDGQGEPGTAGFFKWDPRGPRLVLRDDVFRADQRAGTVGLGLPPGKLAGCSDNVMVWLGRGRYPGRLPGCFTLTRDVQVWERAVRHWQAEQADHIA